MKENKQNICPQCGKESSMDFEPFCSSRCQNLDLHSWFNGTYAIPIMESDEDFDDEG